MNHFRRLILMIIAAVFITAMAYAQAVPDTVKDGLKGPVRTRTVTSCYFDTRFGKSEKKVKAAAVKEYDTNGYLISESVYDGEKILLYRNVWKTASDGRKLELSVYSQNGSLQGRTVYNYNGTLLTSVKKFDMSGKLLSTVAETPGNGPGSVKVVYMDGTGVTNQVSLRISDTNGSLLIQKNYSPEGSLINAVQYSYNSIGRLLTNTTLDSREQAVESRVNNYDDNGNLTMTMLIGADGELVKAQYYNYEGGRVSEIREIGPQGRPAGRQLFFYTGRGFLYEIINYNIKGQPVLKNRYENDQFGNWREFREIRITERFGELQYDVLQLEEAELSYY